MSISQISVIEFLDVLKAQKNPVCVDVRTPAEYGGSRCRGSENLPLQTLTAEQVADHLRQCGGEDSSEIYLICQAGKRAEMAAEKLSLSLPNPLRIVTGGVSAMPEHVMHQGERSMISLERQVRITAGSLVLVGVLLGALVTPAGYYLSAFVGAGLTFAGITDTCAMGMLLAKMPWNQTA
ncbi:MAG: rhodanese-like domain-containing protein [Cellvibrionaceae bacterium]